MRCSIEHAEEHKFFKDNDECPTCSRDNLKLKQKNRDTRKIRRTRRGITKGNDELANLNATIEIFNKTIADYRKVVQDIR